MALFDVPGWSVPAEPTRPTPSSSKKRKRPASMVSVDELQAAQVNVEKLMARLHGDDGGKAGKSSEGGRAKEKRKKGHSTAVKSVDTVQPQPSSRASKATKTTRPPNASEQPQPKKKKQKTKTEPTAHAPAASRDGTSQKSKHDASKKSPGPSKVSADEPQLTPLQKRMKESLGGARFRWINEELYKSDSSHAHALMREDPAVFQEYHSGFRHQVQAWPTNPVAHYVAELSAYPPRTMIADLGCGDAALAQALIPKGFPVLSFDLVSDGAFVVEADICGQLPLPGAHGQTQGSEPGTQIVDVAVFALSLMGTNWPCAIKEAWRILKPGGELKVAEVASRFTDVDEFEALVASLGFRLTSKDDSNSHFTLFNWKRVARKIGDDKMKNLLSKSSVLKPCEYKRR